MTTTASEQRSTPLAGKKRSFGAFSIDSLIGQKQQGQLEKSGNQQPKQVSSESPENLAESKSQRSSPAVATPQLKNNNESSNHSAEDLSSPAAKVQKTQPRPPTPSLASAILFEHARRAAASGTPQEQQQVI